MFDYAAAVSGSKLPAFSMIAEATGSLTFKGTLRSPDSGRACPVSEPRTTFSATAPCREIEVVTPPGGHDLRSRVAPRTHCVFRDGKSVDVACLPDDYPTAAGIEAHGGDYTSIIHAQTAPMYRFLRDDGTERPIDEVAVYPWDDPRMFDNRVIRPTVGTMSIGPPSEFMTLWALLFCLSQLARYYPDQWVAALDPDQSTAAVTEEGLDFALEVAPALIGEGLGAGQVLGIPERSALPWCVRSIQWIRSDRWVVAGSWGRIRIGSNLSGFAVFLDHGEPTVVDRDMFDREVFVAWRNDEGGRTLPDRLVLRSRHGYHLHATG